MNRMYDVQRLLKRFGIIIYTGKRISDLQLMEIEIKELFKAHLISQEEYIKAKQVLRKEMRSSFRRKANE